MSWLDGTPITGPSQSLRDALWRTYAIALRPPERVARSSPTALMAATRSRLDRVEAETAPRDAPAWLDSQEAGALCHVHLRNFVRSDGNLNNMLVAGDLVRFVDFEDFGRGHWVCDLADIVEHARSRGVDERDWVEFFESFDPDDAQRTRFRSARKLQAIAWLSI